MPQVVDPQRVSRGIRYSDAAGWDLVESYNLGGAVAKDSRRVRAVGLRLVGGGGG